MKTHKLDAAWAKGHLDAIRPMVPPEAQHSLDCVRSWLSYPLPEHPEQRETVCSDCNGSGSSSFNPGSCMTCNGTGQA